MSKVDFENQIWGTVLCSHDKYQKDISTVNTASYTVFVSRKINVYCEAKLQKVRTPRDHVSRGLAVYG